MDQPELAFLDLPTEPGVVSAVNISTVPLASAHCGPHDDADLLDLLRQLWPDEAVQARHLLHGRAQSSVLEDCDCLLWHQQRFGPAGVPTSAASLTSLSIRSSQCSNISAPNPSARRG
ncbi:hypothetical protein CP973_27130 [Streptomyces albofaciens JCM 4342]|nr:hypothetical protein CP973_27130 [Streptomyces albofaciens JCM 4342]